MVAKNVKSIESMNEYYAQLNHNIYFKIYDDEINIDEIFLRLMANEECTYYKNKNVHCLKGKYRSIHDFIKACNGMLPEKDKLSALEYILYLLEASSTNKILKLKNIERFYTNKYSEDEQTDKLRIVLDGYYINVTLYVKWFYIRFCPDIKKINSGGVTLSRIPNESHRSSYFLNKFSTINHRSINEINKRFNIDEEFKLKELSKKVISFL